MILNKLKRKDGFNVHKELLIGKEFIPINETDYKLKHNYDWEMIWKKTEGNKRVDYSQNRFFFLPHKDLWK